MTMDVHKQQYDGYSCGKRASGSYGGRGKCTCCTESGSKRGDKRLARRRLKQKDRKACEVAGPMTTWNPCFWEQYRWAKRFLAQKNGEDTT
jgi:hypothetical protein